MSELFTSDTRLFELTWREGGFDLPVEAWWGRETLSGGFELKIDLLSTDALLDLNAMLGRSVTLYSTTADGGRVGRTGLVRTAEALGADGGFARYRVTVVAWTWLMTRTRNNRVFQDKSVMDICERVFAGYADRAAWHWDDGVAPFLADARPRSYCVQYRESDYAFVARLLAEEGIGWCIEEDEDAPAGHRMRLFADSRDFPEDPLSESATGGQGIRYHRADSQEAQDTVVAFGAHRRLDTAVVTALTYDYKAKRAVAVSVPTAMQYGGEHAPALERYDNAGLYAWADGREAERYQRLAMEAIEARYKTFFGRGTVRSFRPGTGFELTGTPFEGDAGARRFSLLDVTHAGINNLSAETIAKVARRLAATPFDEASLDTGDAVVPVQAPAVPAAELLELAETRGYGNAFETLYGQQPWRPVLADATGRRLHPRPTVSGHMTALVVGPGGETAPNGADELYTDRLGRIKVRFHWQRGETGDDRSTCWVRVAQRQAGPGMGWQWLPRIGQEVLVAFLGNDIDRPLVLGALYNGRGEGGVAPTPGGAAADPADLAAFAAATDLAPAAQGNLTGGNGPAWHGAAGDGHGHAAALTGFKSKEFGGTGYSQLVLDDSDAQQRVQLKTTQHASELNLGHLVHQADNYRGSFRGAGAELRTDAWGALRAGRGVVLTTWAASDAAQPSGDLAPGMALLKQATALAASLSAAAACHRTVPLAAAIGSTGPGRSVLDPRAAPAQALSTAAAGMVDAADPGQAVADAEAKRTAVAKDKLPQLTDAVLVQAARAGFATVAGQAIQYTCGATVTFLSGQDTNLAVGGLARIHAGQAIGLVAGASRPGAGDTGFDLIAAQGDVDIQAQSGTLAFQSRQDLKLVSVGADVDFAAAKRVVFAVEGGASITIGGSIQVQCPGTITVHAASKSFNGPTQMHPEMISFVPHEPKLDDKLVLFGRTGKPVPNQPFKIVFDDGRTVQGTTDANGASELLDRNDFVSYRIELLPKA